MRWAVTVHRFCTRLGPQGLAEHTVTNHSQVRALQATTVALLCGRLVERAALCVPFIVACVAGMALSSAAQLAGVPAAGSTMIYSFHPNHSLDGAFPSGRLVRDAAGNLYGTTTFGGANNAGTVYKLDAAGHETVVYSFCPSWGGLGGKFPVGLTQDSMGNLYGATSQGGAYGAGTVFEIDAAGRQTVLYSFCTRVNCADGNDPTDLVWKSGKLYGVTAHGGAYGSGVVFELSLDGQETVTTDCALAADCTNQNLAQEEALDADGNVYRATTVGGESGYGAVYKIAGQGENSATRVRHEPYPASMKISSNLNPGLQGRAISFKAGHEGKTENQPSVPVRAESLFALAAVETLG